MPRPEGGREGVVAQHVLLDRPRLDRHGTAEPRYGFALGGPLLVELAVRRLQTAGRAQPSAPVRGGVPPLQDEVRWTWMGPPT